MNLPARLHDVIASVFGVPAASVSDASSPDTIEAWDSVHHIQLIMALETEFGMQFDPDDIAELTSVGEIRAHLERSGVS